MPRGKVIEAVRNFIRWAENPADDACGMAREQEWLRQARDVLRREEVREAEKVRALDGLSHALNIAEQSDNTVSAHFIKNAMAFIEGEA